MAESDDIAQGWPPLPPARTGLSASCPRCGEGKLFAGLLTPARRCANCGLDYDFIDSGDGPAVFESSCLASFSIEKGLARGYDVLPAAIHRRSARVSSARLRRTWETRPTPKVERKPP